MITKQFEKRAWHAATTLILILLTLWITRPWIVHPLTRSIGFDTPSGNSSKYHFGNPDIIMNLTFCGWPRFALTQLHRWPLARTQYLMYPQGAAHGKSFDGLLIAIVTSLLWCVMPLNTAFNVALLLGLFLFGLAFYRLAGRLWGYGLLPLGLAVSGLCLPFLFQRVMCHANLVYAWTIPVSIHLFLNFYRKPTLKRALAWGLALPLLMLGSWHFLLIGMVFHVCAAAAVALRGLRRAGWLQLKRAVLGWLLGLALVLVIGWPMFAAAGERKHHPMQVLASYSTPLLQQFIPYPYSYAGLFPAPLRLQQSLGTNWEAWSGGPLASILLLLVYLCWRRPRGERGLIAAAAGGALLLSLGPYLQLTRVLPPGQGLKLPLYYLCNWFPAFSVIHVPGRMSLLFHCLALLGSGYMLQTWRGRLRLASWPGRLAWGGAIALLVAVNVTCSHSFKPMSDYPNLPVPQFYQDLGKTPGKKAILDVPISAYWFPQYNYYQFWHKRPVVSSVLFHDAVGRKEMSFIQRRPELSFLCERNKKSATDRVMRRILDEKFMRDLARHKIEYVVMHPLLVTYLMERGDIDLKTVNAYIRFQERWKDRLVYQDDQIKVFRTQPAP